MSVVAWDGRTLAADKQATHASKICVCTKIRRLDTGEVLAWTGAMGPGLAMAKWYENGADLEKWPKSQENKDDWSRLIVASAAGVITYEQYPVALPCEDRFMAWGAGCDFAVGAMAYGASAESAVQIAIRFSDGCGCGIDVFTVRTGA